MAGRHTLLPSQPWGRATLNPILSSGDTLFSIHPEFEGVGRPGEMCPLGVWTWHVICTPVAPSVLRQVNGLLLCAVTLPNILLTGQTRIVGEPPYVTIDYNFELTGAGKIHVFKGLARPDQMNNAK
ncbi:polynucleotide 5'-hydroxyl-kinase NOL9-like isoform X2 [Oncorhynchus nerka]|uniref:polynucleotide 5'-hydroxyl-kinase NOL9-like isoform X2 n=1 Tax=Oncorhynchus nerka TaxID=8023 RepID=UPI0031B887D9